MPLHAPIAHTMRLSEGEAATFNNCNECTVARCGSIWFVVDVVLFCAWVRVLKTKVNPLKSDQPLTSSRIFGLL